MSRSADGPGLMSCESGPSSWRGILGRGGDLDFRPPALVAENHGAACRGAAFAERPRWWPRPSARAASAKRGVGAREL